MGSVEIDRIVELPVFPELTKEELEEFCRNEIDAKYFSEGFRLFPKQAAAIIAYDMLGGLFAPIGVGWGKCVCGNTEVYDVSEGVRRKVTEAGALSVPSLRESDMRIDARQATAFPSGEKPCVRLKLKHGQQLDLSTDHPVLTKNRGWINAADLKPEELVATPRVLPAPQKTNRYLDEEIILAAYMMADGCTAGQAMTFTQMPGEVAEEFKRCVVALGGSYTKKAGSNSGKADDWSVCGLRPWLRSLDLSDCKAVNKRLPAKFYGLSDEQCALFLSRFWACDGWLEADRAGLALANRELLEDVRHLLLRLAITARVEYKPTGEFSAWRLVVSGGTNLERFVSALKTIPGKPWGSLATRNSKAVLYEQDVRWVKVQKVEHIGVHPVYDLNVPDTHTFVANGIVIHNTLITLMIAARAFRGKIERSLLMVPPQVYAQLIRRDIPWARLRLNLNIPFMLMGAKSAEERRAIARSGKKGCYILPYSCLSTKDSTDLLNWISPQLIIMDEAHAVKNRKAARTVRLLDYIKRKQPQLVALSGTITSKSIMDYHHLISAALRENSPLPLSPVLATQWSFVLDAEADPGDAQLGPITPLIQWSQRNFPEVKLPPHVAGFRTAYKQRLTSAPGVVATGDSEIGVSLILSNAPISDYQEQPTWKALKEKIDDVVDRWVSPSGDEIEYSFHQWKYLWELNSGFYYRLQWPSVEELRSRRPMSEAEATEFLEMAKLHHLKLQSYHKELRNWLGRVFIPGLDTPLLVGLHFHHSNGPGKVDSRVYEAWKEAKDHEFPDMPERYSVPVRISPFKVEHVINWMTQLEKGTGGLVWYYHQEVGNWIYQLAQQRGFDVLHCPAGEQHNVAITDPDNGSKIIIASIQAHGTGKNLQHFEHQVFAQFPRDAAQAEQALGRTHRNGQKADELIVHTVNTTDFDHQNFAACLNDALYLHQTVGSRQKLVYAAYDPLPRIYPSDFLRERGFQNRRLSLEEQRILQEKFGT